MTFNITDIAAQWIDHRQSNYGFTLAAASHLEDLRVRIYSSQGLHAPYADISFSEPHHSCPPAPDENATVNSTFSQKEFHLQGTMEHLYSPLINFTDVRTGTFFFLNLGQDPVEAHLQISPDGTNFFDDPQQLHLLSHVLEAVTPYRFAKYVRVELKKGALSHAADVQVWYQAQLLGYSVSHPDFMPLLS